jgi:hypothetical protein
MRDAGFIELHARSAYSFLRGASFPEQLAERAAELEMPALAVCDRDGVYGTPRMHGAAKKQGIRAIVGTELTLEDGTVLPVLVRDRTGYQNLCRLITRAKELSAPIDTWAVMPFDGGSGGDMSAYTKSAVDGLKNHVKSTFGLTDDAAYRRSGLSSMNGKTDNAGEVVSVNDYRAIRDWARTVHLARLSFWALNRDCNNCAGVSQGQYEFTKITANYTG